MQITRVSANQKIVLETSFLMLLIAAASLSEV